MTELRGPDYEIIGRLVVELHEARLRAQKWLAMQHGKLGGTKELTDYPNWHKVDAAEKALDDAWKRLVGGSRYITISEDDHRRGTIDKLPGGTP